MKQRFTYLDIRSISNELDLEPAYIQQVYAHSSKIFSLKLSTKKILIIEIGVRMHLCENALETSVSGYFLTKMRTLLRRNILKKIQQVGFDRILQITTNKHFVFVEFFSGGNIIITDFDLNILSLFRVVKDIQLDIGQKYVFNPVELDFSYSMFLKGFKDMLSVDKIIFEDIKSRFIDQLKLVGYRLSRTDQIVPILNFNESASDLAFPKSPSLGSSILGEENRHSSDEKVFESKNNATELETFDSQKTKRAYKSSDHRTVDRSEKPHFEISNSYFLQLRDILHKFVSKLVSLSQNADSAQKNIQNTNKPDEKSLINRNNGKSENQIDILSHQLLDGSAVRKVLDSERLKNQVDFVSQEPLKGPEVEKVAESVKSENEAGFSSQKPRSEVEKVSDSERLKNEAGFSSQKPRSEVEKVFDKGISLNDPDFSSQESLKGSQTSEASDQKISDHDVQKDSELSHSIERIIMDMLVVCFENRRGMALDQINTMVSAVESLSPGLNVPIMKFLIKFILSEILILEIMKSADFDKNNDSSKSRRFDDIFNISKIKDSNFKVGAQSTRENVTLKIEHPTIKTDSEKSLLKIYNLCLLHDFDFDRLKPDFNFKDDDCYFNDLLLRFLYHLFFETISLEFEGCKNFGLLLNAPKTNNFIPFRLENIPSNSITFETFNKAVETYFMKTISKKKESVKKSEKVASRQENIIRALEKEIEHIQDQIDCINANRELINNLLEVHRRAVETKLDWKQFDLFKAQDSRLGPFIKKTDFKKKKVIVLLNKANDPDSYHENSESSFPKSDKLNTSKVNDPDSYHENLQSLSSKNDKQKFLKANDPDSYHDNSKFLSSKSDKLNISKVNGPDSYRENAFSEFPLPKSGKQIILNKKNIYEIELDFSINIDKNINTLYDLKRKKTEKLTKTSQNIEKVIKNVQSLENKAEKKIKKKNNRKKYWFEKFQYTITTNNHLILGGKSSQENDILVKKYFNNDDLFFHTETRGGSCVILQKGKSAANIDIHQAAHTALCLSNCWKTTIVQDVYYAHREQVSKQAESGEYLPQGAFVIRGKKNFINVHRLEYGIGIIFILKSSKNTSGHFSCDTEDCNFESANIQKLSSGLDLCQKLDNLSTKQGVSGKNTEDHKKLLETDIPFKYTKTPAESDEIEHCLVISGPYELFQDYKYKIKLLPSNDKKGKHVTSILNDFIKQSKQTYEYPWIKQIHPDDIANVLIKDCKVAKTQK